MDAKKDAGKLLRFDMIANCLDRWAEITALAIELRKSVLALKAGKEWAEAHVWQDMRESKEKAWTTSPF